MLPCGVTNALSPLWGWGKAAAMQVVRSPGREEEGKKESCPRSRDIQCAFGIGFQKAWLLSFSTLGSCDMNSWAL